LTVGADPIAELQDRLRQFAAERDWAQFHTPKNLAMALASEVGELIEIFQWLTPDESGNVMGSNRAADVEDEVADVFIYAFRLADILGIDVVAAMHEKIERNEERFPSAEVYGRADTPPS
jgi:dCTP diphosphatase